MSLLSPQLEAFIAVAKYKSVHRAADEVFVTQTAVTQRIRSLERSLSTTLFIRTRRGMMLTPEGEALLRYCNAAKALENKTLPHIQKTGSAVELEMTISAATSFMNSRVIPQCLPVLNQFPNLLINFNANDVENRHHDLRAGDCDFAIIQEEDLTPEITYKKLQSEEFVLVCSEKWRHRPLNEMIKNERIIDYTPSDQLTFNYLKQYDLFDDAKHSRYFANRTENLALLASEGVGYTVLAKAFALPYVKNKQLMILNEGRVFDVIPYLIWYDRPEPPPYFSAIIQAIQ